MDALIKRFALLALVVCSTGASYRTTNFLVTADSPQLAREIGDAAEAYRSRLAKEWLGRELPQWPQPCPIRAVVNPRLGAGGETSFMFNSEPRRFGRPTSAGSLRSAPAGRPFGWNMMVQGSRERVLDSVLPHEITHTIFATHFGRPLPRWADEGACTTVEHASERAKQERLLYEFLTTGKGIAFNDMFAMMEYPSEMLPLYSQGYSVTRFLLQQGGQQTFVKFVQDGLDSNDWTAATQKHYGFESLSELQVTWLDWVKAGCPERRLDTSDESVAEQSSDKASSNLSDPTPISTQNAESVGSPSSSSWYARQRDAVRGGSGRPLPTSKPSPKSTTTGAFTEARPVPAHARPTGGRLVRVPLPAGLQFAPQPPGAGGRRGVLNGWQGPNSKLAARLPRGRSSAVAR